MAKQILVLLLLRKLLLKRKHGLKKVLERNTLKRLELLLLEI